MVRSSLIISALLCVASNAARIEVHKSLYSDTVGDVWVQQGEEHTVCHNGWDKKIASEAACKGKAEQAGSTFYSFTTYKGGRCKHGTKCKLRYGTKWNWVTYKLEEATPAPTVTEEPEVQVTTEEPVAETTTEEPEFETTTVEPEFETTTEEPVLETTTEEPELETTTEEPELETTTTVLIPRTTRRTTLPPTTTERVTEPPAASKYIFGDKDTNGCRVGVGVPFESGEACKAAAQELGYGFLGEIFTPARPQGCYRSGNTVAYNKHSTGMASSICEPICVNPSAGAEDDLPVGACCVCNGIAEGYKQLMMVGEEGKAVAECQDECEEFCEEEGAVFHSCVEAKGVLALRESFGVHAEWEDSGEMCDWPGADYDGSA